LSYVISKGSSQSNLLSGAPTMVYSNSPFDVYLRILILSFSKGVSSYHAPSPTPPRYWASTGIEIDFDLNFISPIVWSSGKRADFVELTLSPNFCNKKKKDCQRFIRKCFNPFSGE